nr:MAG TPA: hypothetical protein [Caudoviricetes sp.]
MSFYGLVRLLIPPPEAAKNANLAMPASEVFF